MSFFALLCKNNYRINVQFVLVLPYLWGMDGCMICSLFKNLLITHFLLNDYLTNYVFVNKNERL